MIRKTIIAAILSSLFAVGAFAQGQGNPDNWCRNGAFPSDTDSFLIGVVTGTKGAKAYFYDDSEDDCPTSESCRGKAYVLPGDTVLVSRTFKYFACSWYTSAKGNSTTGWIKADKLKVSSPNENPELSEWLGKWESSGDSIVLSRGKAPGTIKVKGNAFWQGMGDVHVGELDDTSKPVGNALKIGEDSTDKYACKLTMHLVAGFLIASDNSYCGGMNVRFDGVYRKKK